MILAFIIGLFVGAAAGYALSSLMDANHYDDITRGHP